MPASKVASPRKVKKPTMSVTVVRMIEEAVAGSRFSLTNTTGMIEDLVAPPKVAPDLWDELVGGSPAEGFLRYVGHVTSPLAHRGDTIAHIAEIPETIGSEGE